MKIYFYSSSDSVSSVAFNKQKYKHIAEKNIFPNRQYFVKGKHYIIKNNFKLSKMIYLRNKIIFIYIHATFTNSIPLNFSYFLFFSLTNTTFPCFLKA